MIRRLSGAVLVAVLVGIAGFASPASGHVTVDPGEAEQGGYARVVFRVPNERPNASTTRVQVYLPKGQPVAGVRTMPVPGWTVNVGYRKLSKPIEQHGQRITNVVSTLTWTPIGPDFAIGPNEFMEFPVSLGPLPEASTMVFRTLQTYHNGEVVRWIEPPTEGAEPEHPAPVLELAKPPADGAGAETQVGAARGPDVAAEPEQTSSGAPLWLGVVGVAAGLVALILALIAYGRTRPENSLFDDDDDGDDDEAAEDAGYRESSLEDATVDLADLEDDASQDDMTTERVHPPSGSRG